MYIHILPQKPSVEPEREPAATIKRKPAAEAAAESVETGEAVKSETPHIFHLPKKIAWFII